MLLDWAKRVIPRLGVFWQELVEGTAEPPDQPLAGLFASYNAMNVGQRRAIVHGQGDGAR